jgi:hypothetical protein
MRKHPAELHGIDRGFQSRDVVGHRVERGVVGVVARELEQLAAVIEARGEPGKRADDVVELLLFLAQDLGALGIVPDLGVFELAPDFRQACSLDVEVKDTSAARPCAT